MSNNQSIVAAIQLSGYQSSLYVERSTQLLEELHLRSINYHGPTIAALRSSVRSGGSLTARGTQLYLLIVPEDRAAVGVITLRTDASIAKHLHVGYWLHPSSRGRSMMAVGLRQVFDYLGEVVDLPVVLSATVSLENHASVATLTKLKFRLTSENAVLGLASFQRRLRQRSNFTEGSTFG